MFIDHPTKNNIVILGGGFGGLAAALYLAKTFHRNKRIGRENEIMVVDQKNYHLFTPGLYEAASSRREDAAAGALKNAAAIPFETIFRAKPITFRQGKIAGIDFGRNTLRLQDGAEIQWHVLVSAAGSEVNFFDLPGVKEQSIPFTSLPDAIRIRNTLAEKFKQTIAVGKTLEVVIGGGGLTAVELAGELTGYLKKLLKTIPRQKQKKLAQPFSITIVEAANDIVPGFDAKVVLWTKKRLERLGIKALVGRRIIRATALKIILEPKPDPAGPIYPVSPSRLGTEISYDVFLWAGGVKASELFKKDGLIYDDRGRFVVDECLRAKTSRPEPNTLPIFAIGDGCCYIASDTGKPLAGMAMIAQHQGRYIARHILALLLNKSSAPYRPPRLKYLIPIAGKWAIADLGFFRFKGFFAWMLKELVMLKYLTEILPLRRAVPLWLRAVLLFTRND